MSNILQDSDTPDVIKHGHVPIMPPKEWTRIEHHTQLDVGLLHAYYVQHAYPRHSHDYYVISLIEKGRQSFSHKGTKHLTPAGGVIFINPEEVHTGEAADSRGFELRSLYPTTALMETAAYEVTGRHQTLPFFKDVRVDDRWTTRSVLSLHRTLLQGVGPLESESRLLWTLAQLIKRYADITVDERPLGNEKTVIRQVRQYIEENYAARITLRQLAQFVSLSPYHLLRVFHAEVGMPPYEYLESVRIRQAQRLIESGKPLAEVALEAGFSSQSHFTRHFKKIIGVPPGQYAQKARTSL